MVEPTDTHLTALTAKSVFWSRSGGSAMGFARLSLSCGLRQ